ncbi:MAG: hypothetical protein NZ742_05960 [Acidobacteria bacterium]|nr:hypothetical protein [Acidobacteriota bacterium]MDW7983897.1 hypothetical protein [Acidobacteriota bacterium]
MNTVIDQTRTAVFAVVVERFERRLTEEMSQVSERIPSLEQTFERRLTEVISKVHERITSLEHRFERRLAEETAQLRQEIAELKATSSVGCSSSGLAI